MLADDVRSVFPVYRRLSQRRTPSKVHHYHLVETFDAWESWDVIHTAPDRLRWGIWAYSHAAVKTPHGIRMPEGSYISWANHGHALLGEADVASLASELNGAECNAAHVTDVFGPTLVYSRDAARAQMQAAAHGAAARDRIDETVGSLIKWPLPVQSITRLEWLPNISSDLFLFGATTGIPAAAIAGLQAMAAKGQPMAFLAEAGSDTHPLVAGLAGIASVPHDPPQEDASLRATRGDGPLLSVAHGPVTFDALPTVTQVTARDGSAIYEFGSSAALVLREDSGINIAFWEPVGLDDTWFVPLRDLMHHNPAPFALAAATLDRQLARDDRLRADLIDLDQTGTIAAWRTDDGRISLLAGNLEDGLRDDSVLSRTLLLDFPLSWRDYHWQSSWHGGRAAVIASKASLTLGQGSSMLMVGHP